MTVDALPIELRRVPSAPAEWRAWREKIAAYRNLRRVQTENNPSEQALEFMRCKNDTVYFLLMYGVLLEVREADGAPPEWKPFILFHAQVVMIRTVEWAIKQRALGRGDVIVHKVRDFGASNIICGLTAKHFLFDDVFSAALMSRTYEMTWKAGDPSTLFYKVMAQLNAIDAVPTYLRLPEWLLPPGWNPKTHINQGIISNPTIGKTCTIVGRASTARAQVGGRSTIVIFDEASRWANFGESWANNQAAATTRIAISTPDEVNDDFDSLVTAAESAEVNPELPGPTMIRIPHNANPLHVEGDWLQNEMDRASADGFRAIFEREFLLDDTPVHRQLVYPRFREIDVQHAPYQPFTGQVYCWIDNGISDPAAFVLAQANRATGEISVFDSFEGRGGEDVTFYASVLTGTLLSGLHQYNYDDYPGIYELMGFLSSLLEPIVYIGDPAGNARGGGGGENDTWFRQLSLEASRISNRSIHVYSSPGAEQRTHTYRSQTMNMALPLLRFDLSPGARRALFCLQNSRFSKMQKARETERMRPQHDRMSHVRTCVEWGLVYLRMQRDQTVLHKPAGPTIRSLGGKKFQSVRRVQNQW